MNRITLTMGLFFAPAMLAASAGCHSATTAEPGGAGPGATASSTEGPPVRVAAATPARKTLRLVAVQPGRIEAFEQSPLFAKLPAYVDRIHRDIGDRVERDQPLADLWIPELEDDARQKEAQLVQATAGVGQAAAALRAAEAAVQTAEAGIREAAAGTIRAQGKHQRWKSEHRRIAELAAGGSVDRKLVDETQEELSAAEAALGEAKARVASAEATLTQGKANVEKAKADLAVAHAKVKGAEADLARAKSLLQYTQIRMPYAGIVTERNVHRGDFVQPAGVSTAKPLFTVARSDRVRIFVDVPEMDAPLVEQGAKGSILVQALPGRKIEGTVTRTSWALGPNRTLRTELDVPNPNGLLRPGMYATAEIILKERPNAIALPLTAVVKVDQQAFCYCVDGGKIARRPLTLGLQTPEEVEVVSGLSGKEEVVQSRTASLREGQPVEVTRPADR